MKLSLDIVDGSTLEDFGATGVDAGADPPGVPAPFLEVATMSLMK
jgi:hypothetical protein